MGDPTRLLPRMLGVLKLDQAVYEEIEKDKSATGHAAFIVVATSVLTGAVSGALGGQSGGIVSAVFALVGWAIYAWLAYFVGTKMLAGPETKADWGELARTLGFAQTPRFLVVLALVPGLWPLVRLVMALWVLAATVVALRSALDFSTGRAIVTAIVASIVQAIILEITVGLLAT